MRFIKKNPKHVGYINILGTEIAEYECPECGMGLAVKYNYCPYCGQRLGEFKENPVAKMKVIHMQEERRFIERNIAKNESMSKEDYNDRTGSN